MDILIFSLGAENMINMECQSNSKDKCIFGLLRKLPDHLFKPDSERSLSNDTAGRE
jgi:hypothetical protein